MEPSQLLWNAYIAERLLGTPSGLAPQVKSELSESLRMRRNFLVLGGYAGDASISEPPRNRRNQLLSRILSDLGSAVLAVFWEQSVCYGILTGMDENQAVSVLEPITAQLDCCITLSRPAETCDALEEQYRQASDMVDYAVLSGRKLFTAAQLPETHYDRSCRVLKSRLEYEYMKAVANQEFAVAFHHLERIVMQEMDEDMRSIRRLKHRLLAKTENAMQIMGVAVDDPEEQSPCRELFNAAASGSSLRELLPAVQRIYQALDEDARHRAIAEKDKPGEILSYLEDHFSDPELDSTKVAEACGASKSYVSRVVNRQGGSSFADYVNALRIGAAKELLKNTEMTVDEIGTFVGFTNRWTMLRAFKRFVGMTPQSYRKYSPSK